MRRLSEFSLILEQHFLGKQIIGDSCGYPYMRKMFMRPPNTSNFTWNGTLYLIRQCCNMCK